MIVVALSLLLASCTPVAGADAGMGTGDAGSGIDGGDSTRVLQVVNGAVRMTGGTKTMDAHLGLPINPQRATGGTLTLDGNPTLKHKEQP